jgi:hypothetical protein
MEERDLCSHHLRHWFYRKIDMAGKNYGRQPKLTFYFPFFCYFFSTLLELFRSLGGSDLLGFWSVLVGGGFVVLIVWLTGIQGGSPFPSSQGWVFCCTHLEGLVWLFFLRELGFLSAIFSLFSILNATVSGDLAFL